MGETAISLNKQMEQIERIAQGVNLDTLTYVMGILSQRQQAARQAIESIRRGLVNPQDLIDYLNSMNALINEALITKI